ncbi:MAG: hypothetical protein K2X51_07790 [Burkholderiales bacterium]|nr:hypothetical protein [Burkholderiales bacterium]
MNHLSNALKVLLVALAGGASFYLAAHWQQRSNVSSQAIVQAVTRSNHALGAPSSPAQAATNQERDATLALPLRSRPVPDSRGDAFAKLSWLPPPPPVQIAPRAPPPPPPVPVAPPLPFTFVGLMEQGASTPQAFLAKGDVLLVVKAGDSLDNNTYRVETLSAQQIVMTYLPLNTTQTLKILGASN